MSQAQLAGEELTKGFISQVESNLVRPSVRSLQIIAGRLGKSLDYGVTWNVTNITPMNMYSYYQSLAVNENGDLGVSFYATPDMPVANNSSWYLYGAVQRNADISDINLNFSKASPDPVFVGARVNALGDLFESVFTPDNSYNIGFERRVGTQRFLFFVKGALPD